MRIMRIVPNIATKDAGRAKTFYRDILGLDVAMDMGWIATFEADAVMRPQLSVAAHGGSGTAVPDFTIEVDDLQQALRRFQEAKIAIEYGPIAEPWGVKRFYARDPFGRLLNIMQHSR
ncbi:VOC family protein [Bradyrhizobium commune]|uniref:VOC family protein n=1 Tax=Bradyrhizobium commune TaxID=83627 RepID=A0A7S9GZA0_9BRAD|nr:VOC family protein [Bradyrhizobium commune]QPF90676.1 VOC family protein [Bradyrhizobium commune]